MKNAFKVGDKVRIVKPSEHFVWVSGMETEIGKVGEITVIDGSCCKIKENHFYFPLDCLELIERKRNYPFNLQPFNKVLVRNEDDEKWQPAFFSSYKEDDKYPFKAIAASNYINWKQCIPYNMYRHVCNTSEDINIIY